MRTLRKLKFSGQYVRRIIELCFYVQASSQGNGLLFSFPILTYCSSLSSACFLDHQYQRPILYIRKLSQKIKLDDTIRMMGTKQEKQWMIVGSNKVRKIH